MRSSASCFNFRYPVVYLRSFRSLFLLLPRLLVTSVFPSVTCYEGSSYARCDQSRYPSFVLLYRGVDKSLARPTSRCILFNGENISFAASLVIYINITNIPPIMIINRIYETQNLLSL